MEPSQVKKSTNIPTSNRFEPLTDLENEKDAPEASSKKKPPPIIIPGKTLAGSIGTTLLANGYKDQHINFTTNNINIYVHNYTDHKKIKTLLNNRGIQFYTHTPANERTHAFVLRGLDCDPDPNDIQEELVHRYDLEVIRVSKMITTRCPLFLVITQNNITQKQLEKINIINYTKVSWERHQNKKIIIQCYRCQRWGHATANCQMNAKCLKCVGDHHTRECKKPDTTPATCVNCGEDHPANSIECRVYKNK